MIAGRPIAGSPVSGLTGAGASVSVGISPAAGHYYIGSGPGLEIVVSCADDTAALFYTIDGTDPYVSGLPYGGAFRIEVSGRVRAAAVVDGSFAGAAQADYTIEKTLIAGRIVRWLDMIGETDAVVAALWTMTDGLDAPQNVTWSETTRRDAPIEINWSAVARADVILNTPWSAMDRVDTCLGLTWSRVDVLDDQLAMLWDCVASAGMITAVDWDAISDADSRYGLPWGGMSLIDFTLSLVWDGLSPRDHHIGVPWTKMQPCDLLTRTAHTQGQGTLIDNRLITCTDLPWISAARIIMTRQNVTFRRVVDDAPIRILSGSFGIDENSMDYEFAAVAASREDLDLVRPNALGAGTGEVEVELTINGYAARFMVGSYAANRQWGRGTYSISGRSPSCALGPGYCVPETAIYTDTTAEQIVANTLSGTGWTHDWGLVTNTWPINGEFSVVDKTKIEIIAEIAKATGGIVQTDPVAKVIRLKKRHPVSPKNYGSTTPDEFILAGVLTESAQWQTAPKYNQVVVRGKETGYFLTVRRENTAGDIPAPDIIDPLLTAQALNIERGRAFLDANGYDRQAVTVELPLPEAGSGQRPKMLFPCELVEVDDGTEIWRGRVTSAEIGFETAKTRQRIGVERYYV